MLDSGDGGAYVADAGGRMEIGSGADCGDLSADGFVRVNARGAFELSGEEFVPRGINSYPLLQHAGEGRLEALHDIFDQAASLGRRVVRTPAFMDVGESQARIRSDDGGLLEEGLFALDQVLSIAEQYDVRLILILTNNWADFGGAPAVVELLAPGGRLSKDAFWSDSRAIDLQLGYQRALAERVNTLTGRAYRDDPTIFAWELANEARCTKRSLCDERTLVRWARRMSDGLRASCVQQLISWGGGGYLGEYGEDLRLIAAEGGVDVLTFHMYGSMLARDPELAIEWGLSSLRERSQAVGQFGLPLLLEEVNWKPGPESDRDAERATVLGAWLEAAAEEGMGTLPWMIGERGRRDYDGYLIRPEDSATIRTLTSE